MKILDNYIARHVVGGALLALAVLLSLTAAVSFVEELDSVGTGRYGIGDASAARLTTEPLRVFRRQSLDAARDQELASPDCPGACPGGRGRCRCGR